jgi:hypothetical protein
MPKPPRAVHTGEGKSRGQHSVGKLQLYEILYNLNHGVEQVLAQLQIPEKLGQGTPAVERSTRFVEESRAEANFELCRAARGARRDVLYLLWPASSRAGEEASRSPKCAIEADRLWEPLKKRRHSGAKPHNNSPPLRLVSRPHERRDFCARPICKRGVLRSGEPASRVFIH